MSRKQLMGRHATYCSFWNSRHLEGRSWSNSADLICGVPTSLPGEFLAPSPRYGCHRRITQNARETISQTLHLKPSSDMVRRKHKFLRNWRQIHRFLCVATFHDTHSLLTYEGLHRVISRQEKHFLMNVRGETLQSIDRLKPVFLHPDDKLNDS